MNGSSTEKPAEIDVMSDISRPSKTLHKNKESTSGSARPSVAEITLASSTAGSEKRYSETVELQIPASERQGKGKPVDPTA